MAFLLVSAAVSPFVEHEVAEGLGVLGMVSGQLTAAILSFRAADRLEHRERRAWRFFASAMTLAFLGLVVIGVWSVIQGDLDPFGVTDAFFLATYVMLIVAVVKMARIDSEGSDYAS